MFNKPVKGLTMASDAADALFPNIKIFGPHYNGDESFLATMRALLHSRVPEQDTVELRTGRLTYTKSTINTHEAVDVIRAMTRDAAMNNREKNGVLFVGFMQAGEEDNDAMMKLLDDNGITSVPGFVRQEQANKFFAQKNFDVRVFINEARRSAMVFVNNMNLKKWHLIESVLPIYFPWYFRDNKPNEEEAAILRTLTTRYAPNYEELIEQYAKKFDFRTMVIKKALKGFETKFERVRLDGIRSAIARQNRLLSDLDSQFRTIYQEIRDLQIQELGLTEKIEQGGGEETGEIMDFFLANKALRLISVENAKMTFVVETYLNNFDPEVYERAIDNDRSFFYRGGNPNLGKETMKQLMNAIFCTEQLKIRTCAAFVLDFADGYYEAVEGYQFTNDLRSCSLPNPHLYHHGCLGDNRRQIQDAMMRRDYVAAITSCIASATNINFTDGTVCREFISDFCDPSATKFIELPGGKTVTPVEAAKWLEEQNEKEKEKEE